MKLYDTVSASELRTIFERKKLEDMICFRHLLKFAAGIIAGACVVVSSASSQEAEYDPEKPTQCSLVDERYFLEIAMFQRTGALIFDSLGLVAVGLSCDRDLTACYGHLPAEDTYGGMRVLLFQEEFSKLTLLDILPDDDAPIVERLDVSCTNTPPTEIDN